MSESQKVGIGLCCFFELVIIVLLVGLISSGEPFLPMGVVLILLMALLGLLIGSIVRDRLLPETVTAMFDRQLGTAFTAKGQRKLRRQLLDAARLFVDGKHAQSMCCLKKLELECSHPADFAAVYVFMALNCFRTKDHKGAVSFYRNSLAYIPDQPRTLSNLCTNLTALEQYQEAIQSGMEAIRLNEMDPYAHGNVAYALLCAGRTEEAIDYANRALELDSRLRLPMQVLSTAYTRLGNEEQSAYYRNMILTRFPPSKNGK